MDSTLMRSYALVGGDVLTTQCGTQIVGSTVTMSFRVLESRIR